VTSPALKNVHFLGVVPRAEGIKAYPEVAQNVLLWSEKAGLDGVLVFNGAGTVIDPWALAVAAAAGTKELVPLVALNPVYQHPYLAARLIASIGSMFGRRVDLNLITGAATGELAALGDDLDHDGRYLRLAEFTDIVVNLLASPRPYSFEGKYYKVSRLQITPPLPRDLLPHLYVAGQSAARLEVMRRFEAVNLQMLSAPDQNLQETVAGALNFGVVTRPENDQAFAAAEAYFPADPVGSEIMSEVMGNTDSTWKRNLFDAAQKNTRTDGLYWLRPFRSGQADCPYLVGSYSELAEGLVHLVAQGARAFIIDVPASEAEFMHLSKLVALVRERLGLD
jgi:alkanesulfonate monooxygenase